MAVELGKNGYEGEKDIAAQKEIYAAFLALMMELIKTIPGFSPRIDIQKGQGLTIERKPPSQAIEDVVEIEQKPLPEAIQNEPAKKPGIQTLYGVGQNDLTPNDIKAISAIIAGKKGDTVIGGEGLIIKYNGKTLFETDERGKISLHTAVSPEIREKFTTLQAGQQTPLPANAPTNGARQIPKAQEAVAQSQAQEQVGNLFAKLVNSLPAIGVPKVLEKMPANNIVLPPNFKTEERRVAEQEPISKAPDNIVTEQLTTEVPEKQTAINPESASEELDDVPVPKFRLWGEENNALNQTEQLTTESVPVVSYEDVPAIELSPDAVAEKQIVEYAGEDPPDVEQVEATEPVVVPKKSILNRAGDYIADRAKRDSQTVADAATQMASNVGINIATSLAQGFQSIPDVINDQYRAIKTRLTSNVIPQNDSKLKASINDYMDQVGDMFDELQQDDPNLGLSASYITGKTIEIDGLEPNYDTQIEPVAETIDETEKITQSPEPQSSEVSKPAKLKAVSIEDALHYMSQRDDGAKKQDGKGYNLNDTGIGKQLTAQINKGESLNSSQAEEALAMLKKYHKQFAEGGIKLPAWKAVQTQYSEPAYSATDQRAIFTKQQQKLDETMPPGQQEAVLKAVYRVHTLNAPEQNSPVQPGRYELELPTGSKLVNEIDDWGINSLSIEKDGKSILLGGVAMPGNYMPASTLPSAMPELRQLKTFLTGELKLSPEPVNAIPLNQPLPGNKNDASESLEPKTDAEEKPYTITPQEKPYTITPSEKPEASEAVKQPAISRGGR